MLKRVLILLLLTTSLSAAAQEALVPRPSPLAMIRIRYKEAYLKITYSQPHKNGRQIFGGIVPYGQVWRLGANEATELTITKDVHVNNQLLKAGTYSLFAIPEKDKWTIIINSEPGLWGSYNYNNRLDVLRFDVPTKSIDNVVYEPFTIAAEQSNSLINLSFMWDNVKVTFPIKFLN